jgi:hypothetical protein
MQYIARKRKQRKADEDKDTTFHVRSRVVQPEKIDRTVKRKKELEDALLSAPSPAMRRFLFLAEYLIYSNL